MPLLDAIEQEPVAPAMASVIWMHGLGASGDDFASIPPELGLPPELAVRYIFPHAPSMPVTINQGMRMPAWYDIRSLDARGQDEAGIRQSETAIRALIDREVDRGVPPEQIVLAGFSQGGAMALHTGLRYPQRLAGIMVLSAYLLLHEKLPAELHDANRQTPIFQAHGLYDPMVTLGLGRQCFGLLEGASLEAEWHEYPMAHQVCIEEIRDIGGWLSRVLRPRPAATV